MSLALDIASWFLLLAGGAFCLVGALGMLRMPDFYTRIHAASVSDAVGAGLILTGLLLQAGVELLALGHVLVRRHPPAAAHGPADDGYGPPVAQVVDRRRRGIVGELQALSRRLFGDTR